MNAIRSTLFMVFAITWSIFVAPSLSSLPSFSEASGDTARESLAGLVFNGVENISGHPPESYWSGKTCRRSPALFFQASVGMGNHGFARLCTERCVLCFRPEKELLRIPLVGWGLGAMKMISIDRAAGKNALDQIVIQGRSDCNKGFYVIIFPEGTRAAPGQKNGSNRVALALATQVGCKVVPPPTMQESCGPRQAF